MTEFADLTAVLNRLSGGNSGNPENVLYMKEPRTRSSGTNYTKATGKWFSLWLADGGQPGCGVAPTTAAVPNKSTRGAPAFANASGGREKRLLCAAVCAPSTNPSSGPFLDTLILFDRLFHIGNLDATVTTAQNVQSGSGVTIDRHTNGDGNEIWLEVYATALGGTGTTATCSYTNQNGTAGRTTQAIRVGGSSTGIASIGEVCRFPLQAGDTGVQSVETCTLAASTTSAGVWGITIVNRICSVAISESWAIHDFTFSEAGTYIIEDNTCIGAYMHCSTTNDIAISCLLTTAEN